MILSLFLLTLTSSSIPSPDAASVRESQLRACIQNCQAWSDRPGYEIRACVTKCQEAAR